MEKRAEQAILEEMQALAKKRDKVLEEITIEKLDFNPFLLMVLGLKTAVDIAKFMVGQRILRILFMIMPITNLMSNCGRWCVFTRQVCTI
jgi:hypothetical protein